MAQSSITPEISAHIEAVRAQGTRSKAALLRGLEARGVHLNWRTLARYLDDHPTVAVITPPAPTIREGRVEPAVGQCGSPVDSDLESRVRAVLAGEDVDVADLARHALRVKDPLAAWGTRCSYEPAAARTYATLAKLYAELVGSINELRPRAEVEADRLDTLGAAARTALIERARAAARNEVDLRRRVVAQAAVIDRLTGGAK
jgi:hypothetical protein